MTDAVAGMTLEILRWDDARSAARAVRDAVFILEQGIPRELEWDACDPSSWHCVVRDARGRACGTGRLLSDGHIGRMAVLADRRGLGVGRAMLDALIGQARSDGHPRVVLNAQILATDFYARHGFRPRGEPYLEAGIVHLTMERAVDQTAPSTKA